MIQVLDTLLKSSGTKWLAASSVALFFLGCNLDLSNLGTGTCSPVCAPGTCGYDGCEGQCPCSVGEECGPNFECIDEGFCTTTCEEAGWECNELCGNACGSCDEGKACQEGKCECQATCDALTCGDDGCGGSCSCPTGFACNDGKCIADPVCTDTCATIGWECGGTICDEECGPCAANEACEDHECVCVPRCEGNACGSDGCGGTCPCEDGYLCNSQGSCEEDTSCNTTCKEGGFKCGELCGHFCGECQEGYECENGQCVGGCHETCQSTGWVCGEVCGEACGECGSDQECMEGSCYPYTLQLSVSGRATVGAQTQITLLIDYDPRPGEPRPRMADFRITTDKSVNLEVDSVTMGPAMGKKQLYIDPISEKPWRIRPDGSVQLLIHSLTNLDTLREGHLLWITVTCEIEDSVKFSLIKRHQTFAPFEADFALQESAYNKAVVVKK